MVSIQKYEQIESPKCDSAFCKGKNAVIKLMAMNAKEGNMCLCKECLEEIKNAAD